MKIFANRQYLMVGFFYPKLGGFCMSEDTYCMEKKEYQYQIEKLQSHIDCLIVAEHLLVYCGSCDDGK